VYRPAACRDRECDLQRNRCEDDGVADVTREGGGGVEGVETMVLSQDEIKESVKAELRVALAYFVERQKLVAQAMLDMGLDLNEVGEFGAAAWVWNPQSESTNIDDDIRKQIAKSDNPQMKKLFQLALRSSERKLPQSGIWVDRESNEWIYFLHGKGCRLVNVKTGEPIDWDCPDINEYDRWKFMFHLMWQISSSERAEKLISTHNWVSNSLEPLMEEISNEKS